MEHAPFSQISAQPQTFLLEVACNVLLTTILTTGLAHLNRLLPQLFLQLQIVSLLIPIIVVNALNVFQAFIQTQTNA